MKQRPAIDKGVGRKIGNESRPLAYRPDSAARAIGVSRDIIFRLLAAGEIRSFKENGTRIIPAIALEEYLERRLASELGTCATDITRA